MDIGDKAAKQAQDVPMHVDFAQTAEHRQREQTRAMYDQLRKERESTAGLVAQLEGDLQMVGAALDAAIAAANQRIQALDAALGVWPSVAEDAMPTPSGEYR